MGGGRLAGEMGPGTTARGAGAAGAGAGAGTGAGVDGRAGGPAIVPVSDPRDAGEGARAATGGVRAGFGAGCAICFGRTRLGSDFGTRVVIPVGPLRDTWFGSTLSRRHWLMVSPSPRASGLP